MKIAKSSIGTKPKYDIIYNNCEYFVTECVYGSRFSTQTEIKYKSWTQYFIIKYFVLLFIYFSIVLHATKSLCQLYFSNISESVQGIKVWFLSIFNIFTICNGDRSPTVRQHSNTQRLVISVNLPNCSFIITYELIFSLKLLALI